MKMYAAHIAAKGEECRVKGQLFTDSIPPHMRMHLKYVTQWLLEGDAYHVYSHFIFHFNQIHEVEASLVPNIIEVMNILFAVLG